MKRLLTQEGLVSRLKQLGYSFEVGPSGVVVNDPLVSWEICADGVLRLIPQLTYVHSAASVTRLLEQVSREEEDLRDGPFCGNDPAPRVEQKTARIRWMIVCDYCGVRTDTYDNLELARKTWNKHS